MYPRIPGRSIRRRILTVFGLAFVIGAIGVQAATGASSQAGGDAVVATPMDTTPANQPSLDAAADDAQSVAGSAYYTDAVVNDAANTVDVYLAGAPQSVVDQLQSLHPGIYVIHNDAAHPLSVLLALRNSLPLAALGVEGVDVVTAYVSPEGYLEIGVKSSTDVQAAQAGFNSADGAGVVQVYGGDQPGTGTGYRYNDPTSTPWNGGDFITHKGTDRFNNQTGVFSDCSSGLGVHKTGDTSLTYVITAAHCAWIYGTNANPGYGIEFDNGYYRGDNNTLYSGSSDADIGTVKHISNDSAK